MPGSKHVSPLVEKEHLDNIQEKESDLYDILDDQKLVNRIRQVVCHYPPCATMMFTDLVQTKG